MPKVYRRAVAKRDLVEHFVYLAENADLEIAERFLTSAEASFKDLADQPMIGAPLALRHPELAELRKWRVNNFDNFLNVRIEAWILEQAGTKFAETKSHLRGAKLPNNYSYN